MTEAAEAFCAACGWDYRITPTKHPPDHLMDAVTHAERRWIEALALLVELSRCATNLRRSLADLAV